MSKRKRPRERDQRAERRRDWPTEALRRRSLAILRGGLIDYLRRNAGFHEHGDYRDVLIGLAPFHDCARRLGADPARVFAEAAADVAEDVGSLAIGFGQRTDVTLSSFGWELVEDLEQGSTYRYKGWGGGFTTSQPLAEPS